MILVYSVLIHLKTQTKYKINCFFTIGNSLIFFIINFSLWYTLYKTNYISYEKFKNTIQHVFLINILNQLISGDFENIIGNKIINGDIVYSLIQPYNTFFLLLSEHLAYLLFRFIFFTFPFSFFIFYLFDFNIDYKNLHFFLLSLIFSFIIMISIETIVGLLTIKISQIFGLSLLKNTLVSILAGVTIPLSYYPTLLRKIFSFLPFYHALNTPLNLINPNLSKLHLLTSLGIQIVWAISLIMVSYFFWSYLVRKININGG